MAGRAKTPNKMYKSPTGMLSVVKKRPATSWTEKQKEALKKIGEKNTEYTKKFTFDTIDSIIKALPKSAYIQLSHQFSTEDVSLDLKKKLIYLGNPLSGHVVIPLNRLIGENGKLLRTLTEFSHDKKTNKNVGKILTAFKIRPSEAISAYHASRIFPKEKIILEGGYSKKELNELFTEPVVTKILKNK